MISSTTAYAQKTLKKQNLAGVHAVADINQQVATLFAQESLAGVPMEWLQHYPRYLKAILMRLEKLPLNPIINHQ